MPKTGRQIPKVTLAYNLAVQFSIPVPRSRVERTLMEYRRSNPGTWPRLRSEEGRKLVDSAIRYMKKRGTFQEGE